MLQIIKISAVGTASGLMIASGAGSDLFFSFFFLITKKRHEEYFKNVIKTLHINFDFMLTGRKTGKRSRGDMG